MGRYHQNYLFSIKKFIDNIGHFLNDSYKLKLNLSNFLFSESWIELTNNLIQSCPDRVTPPLPFSSGEEYLRLLKEAQKESNPGSLIGSRRDSPKVGSPKSPPNSPNTEPLTNEEELRGVFINYYASKVR